MLKILGKRSSINVRKVLWTCDEVGLTYQQEDYGSGFQPVDTAEFRALNPNALVPVLLDDDGDADPTEAVGVEESEEDALARAMAEERAAQEMDA